MRKPPLLLASSPSGIDPRVAFGRHRSWLLCARAVGDAGHGNLRSCETFRCAGISPSRARLDAVGNGFLNTWLCALRELS